MTNACSVNSSFPQLQLLRRKPVPLPRRLKHRLVYGRPRQGSTGKELDRETGLYYYGARYLDPKTSRWMSGDPALGERGEPERIVRADRWGTRQPGGVSVYALKNGFYVVEPSGDTFTIIEPKGKYIGNR